MNEPWDSQMESLGAFIRSKRKLANLSLRQLAERPSCPTPTSARSSEVCISRQCR